MNLLQIEYSEYLKNIKSLKLCIVGQDRYPKGANGIAFCKNSFDEFFDFYCCGKDVLYSLGYSEEMIRNKYSDPIELFFDLLSKGIGFINISYELLDETTEELFIAYQKYNRLFLIKSDRIVVLGSSRTKPLFEKQYHDFKIYKTLIHPSLKAKEYDEVEWKRKWETKYLKSVYDGDI